MSKKKTKSSAIDFTQIVREVCEEYGDDVTQEATQIVTRMAPQIVDKLRQSPTPRSEYAHPHYADDWVYETKTDSYGTVKVTVYNKDKWQLTWLLENGYEIVRGGKHYGRKSGVKHIKPAQEWAVEQIVKELENKL